MYPTVVISTFAYVFCQYWWVLSLLTMMPAAYVDYSLVVQGLFFLGLIVGTIVGELLFSGRQSDWLMVRLSKRNGGEKNPEMRLWFGYPGAILSSVGLVIWGLSIDRKWHWITGQIAFFLCEFLSLPSDNWYQRCDSTLMDSSRRWSANWQHSSLRIYC